LPPRGHNNPPPTLNPVLRDFWETPARNRVLYGGRDSTKSWDAAGFAVFLAQSCKIRVLCTRQFQNKISESVYTLLKIQIARFGLEGEFDITKNTITHKITGSEFIFYGLWRHIDEIKSLEGIDILWIEEAHNLTHDQWKILEPTIRKDGSQVWIIFNPRYATDFVYKRFVLKPPPDTIVRKINFNENPFLSETSKRIIANARDEDYEEFEHVYLGVPHDDDEGVIIKRSWINSAIDAHKTIYPETGEWFGERVVGFDVADDGPDLNSMAKMDGSVLVGVEEWRGAEDQIHKSVYRVLNAAKAFDAKTIGYDSIGVGAFVGSALNEKKWRKHYEFDAGGKVHDPLRIARGTKQINKDYYLNIKAQAWWHLAMRFLNTHLAVTTGKRFAARDMISLSSDCDSKLLNKTIDELATPRRDFDSAGAKVKVESKKDLKKREIKSPNNADAVIIATSRNMMARPKLKDWM